MKPAQQITKRLAVFTDKHPFIGPLLWISSFQFFVVQIIVAAAWISPRYDWFYHLISDLGAVGCGVFNSRVVCSPLYSLMNISFIIFGITITLGSLLLYAQFRRTKLSLVGFGLMAFSGIGTIMVGAFPEDVNIPLHGIGAVLALLLGNVSIMMLAFAISDARPMFRFYTFISGFISTVGFFLFFGGYYFGLQAGGMERLVSYLFTIWMILLGVYMTAVRIRARNISRKSKLL